MHLTPAGSIEGPLVLRRNIIEMIDHNPRSLKVRYDVGFIKLGTWIVIRRMAFPLHLYKSRSKISY